MLRDESELQLTPTLTPVPAGATPARPQAPRPQPQIPTLGGIPGRRGPLIPNGSGPMQAPETGRVDPVRVPENPRTAPTATPVAGRVQPMTPLGPVPAQPATGTGPITTTTGSTSPFPETNPNDPLTGRTIQRTPEQDRFAIAQQRFNTFVESTDPQYQAVLRDANRYGAATGRLGSGDLRTDFGNLAGQRDLQLRTQGNTFLQNALEGSIDDQFRDLGVAQQQQGFQNQQQQQAFENELRRLGFSEDMINSAFGRALQQYQAGQAGGTGSGSGIAVGQNQFNQGQDALDALNRLIRGNPGTGAPTTTPPINPGATRYPWQLPVPEGAA